jgi:hypothetical protein
LGVILETKDGYATIDEVRKAIQESIEKNKELYEMLKQYDEQKEKKD